MLKIQEYLRQHGVVKTVEDFKLIHKVKGDLNMFKYNQIESNYALPEVQEARGLILDAANDWNIVCYTFHKFFNTQEGFAHPIDWNDCVVYKKEDGSILQLYYYQNEWHVATSGTIDADTYSNDGLISFKDLFWKTVSVHYGMTKDEFTSKFNPNYCYAFELCTPFNLVITQHKTFRLILLGLRNKHTLLEESINQYYLEFLQKPETFDLKNLETVTESLKGKDWQDEGYVVCDQYFNRQKIKNPAYVAVHHLKGNLGAHHVMQVVKDNEIEEFCIYAPERREEVEMLKKEYDILAASLELIYKIELNGGVYDTVKDFALDVQKKVERKFQPVMYSVQKGKTTFKDYVYNMDNKDLYLLFTNKADLLK
jgi:hypothetical protein